jgi:hypothetical protein
VFDALVFDHWAEVCFTPRFAMAGTSSVWDSNSDVTDSIGFASETSSTNGGRPNSSHSAGVPNGNWKTVVSRPARHARPAWTMTSRQRLRLARVLDR